MNSFLQSQNQNPLTQSNVSQYSSSSFYLKNQNYLTYQKKDFQSAQHEDKNHIQTQNNHNKKLLLKDLDTQKSKKQLIFQSGKQNNIPNQAEVLTNQSRKIIIHKNYSISPYKANTPHQVQDSFNTNKIVQLQQQLIELRKQMTLKQSSWMKQKSILLNKIQISNFDVAQMKQRNNNLIQINQTLTQALGETMKNSNSYESASNVNELKQQINDKNKRIKEIQQKLSRTQKEKYDLSVKLNEQIQKNQYMSKNIQDYKTILKQSNQRKLQTDQKVLLFIKNVQSIKQKLKSLPIKDQYLHPIHAYLDSMKNFDLNHKQNSYFSDILSEGQQSGFSNQRQKYSQESQYLKIQSENNGGFKNNYKHNRERDSYTPVQNHYEDNQSSYIRWQKSTEHKPSRKSSANHPQNKRFLFNDTKRVDTDQNCFENDSQSYNQNQQQEEMYLCDICQRVYDHQQFLEHINECKQYQNLLKQKKQIQSRLISIKQQQYDSRKSNVSSLNSSAIILNKSKSKGKFIKNQQKLNQANNRPSFNRHNPNHNQFDDQRDNYSTNQRQSYKRKNGNKTQRNAKNQQKSRLQLSQLLNISNISSRPNNLEYRQEKFFRKQSPHQNNYYSSRYESNNSTNYQIKKNPQIRYQTNITSQRSDLNNNRNVGKQSMQQEIRKIVQALNQTGKHTNRSQMNGKSQISMKKQQNNKFSPINPSSKNNIEKQTYMQKQNVFKNGHKIKNGKYK